MKSLFLRIFLSFWVAQALFVVLTILVTVAMRPDGKDQVAAAGQPLYTFAGDTSAGDTNGEGVAGIWHVVKAEAAGTQPPAGATATTAKPTATTTGSYSGY